MSTILSGIHDIATEFAAFIDEFIDPSHNAPHRTEAECRDVTRAMRCEESPISPAAIRAKFSRPWEYFFSTWLVTKHGLHVSENDIAAEVSGSLSSWEAHLWVRAASLDAVGYHHVEITTLWSTASGGVAGSRLSSQDDNHGASRDERRVRDKLQPVVARCRILVGVSLSDDQWREAIRAEGGKIARCEPQRGGLDSFAPTVCAERLNGLLRWAAWAA